MIKRVKKKLNDLTTGVPRRNKTLNIIWFALVFLFFLLIYIGSHAYVSFRLSSLLGIQRDLIFYVVMIFLMLFFPLMSLVERFVDGKLSTMFYTASSVWVGMVFYLLFILLGYEVIKLFVKIDSRIAGIFVLIIVAIITIYSVINASFVVIKKVDVPMPGLNKRLKVVQLSDIHVGTINGDTFLQKIIDKTNALNPDIVLITGDLVDGSGMLTPRSIEPLNDIKAKVFFSIGNHEQYEGLNNITRFLSKSNITVLRNEVQTYKGIQIIGIDDAGHSLNAVDPFESIKIDKSKPSILMNHRPSNLDKAESHGVNLQLSGHTHAGQLFPFNLFVKLQFPKDYGSYKIGNMYLYVSSGAGTWGPPFRLGSNNEIVLINLIGKK